MNTNCRRGKAQSLVEITVGIVIFIPVLLVLFDLSMILFASQQNENMCRNAAQAAATGDPAQAEARARIVVDQQNQSHFGNVIPNFRLSSPVETIITSRPPVAHDLITDKFYNPGGPISGTAIVATEVDVKPFIVHTLYTGKSPLTFRTKQSFPIKYVMPREAVPRDENAE